MNLEIWVFFFSILQWELGGWYSHHGHFLFAHKIELLSHCNIYKNRSADCFVILAMHTVALSQTMGTAERRASASVFIFPPARCSLQ